MLSYEFPGDWESTYSALSDYSAIVDGIIIWFIAELHCAISKTSLRQRTHAPDIFIACFLFPAWPGGGLATIFCCPITAHCRHWSTSQTGAIQEYHLPGCPARWHQGCNNRFIQPELSISVLFSLSSEEATTQSKKVAITTVRNYKTPDGTLYIVVSATVTLTSIQHRDWSARSRGNGRMRIMARFPPAHPETVDITDENRSAGR